MTRVQLRLTGYAERIFLSLVEGLKSTQKDVVLDALGLLHFAADQIRHGRKVGSYDPVTKEFTALTTPSLESLASSARTQEVRAAAVGR